MILVTKDVDCDVSTAYCRSLSGDRVDWLCVTINYVAGWLAVIGEFRSSLFLVAAFYHLMKTSSNVVEMLQCMDTWMYCRTGDCKDKLIVHCILFSLSLLMPAISYYSKPGWTTHLTRFWSDRIHLFGQWMKLKWNLHFAPHSACGLVSLYVFFPPDIKFEWQHFHSERSSSNGRGAHTLLVQVFPWCTHGHRK